MEKARSFRDLEVWQKAHQLVLEIYNETNDFPPEEKYGLSSQMRRAAVSIPANIAEGFIKRGKRDKANFYNIAQGSLQEVKYYVILSKDLGYTSNLRIISELAEEVGKMLHSLVSSLTTVC